LQVQHRLAVSANRALSTVSGADYLETTQAFTRHQTAFVERLLAEQDWDVAFVGYHPLDFINHFTADSATHLRAYQMADEMVGRLVALAGNDATIIIASDHGSMQCTRHISLSRVFEDAGLTVSQPRIASDAIPWVLSAILPDGFDPLATWLVARIWDRLPGWVQRLLSWLPLKKYPGWAHYYGSIDWSRTRAYVTSSAKTIYVNRSDVFPDGIVDPGPEYEKLRDEIIAKLEAIRDPETQKPVFRVQRTEDVWHGPYVNAEAPDLILSLAEERYVLQQSDARGRAFWDAGPEEPGGVHRHHGVLLVAGEGIRRGVTLPSAELVDVVPTLLYLMNVPLPLELDGQPIESAIEPTYLEQRPVEMANYARPDTYQPSAIEYTEEELRSVMEKLRGLGYLE
jgi:predicted AlkP superfamily phosphohydrolase/phosphomutase